MQCPRCQHENSPGQKFCGECGAPTAGFGLVRAYEDLTDEIKRLSGSLREALDQQTATSDILRVISCSPTSLESIAQAIADTAGRLCNCAFSAVFRFDGELIHWVAARGASGVQVEALRGVWPRPPDRETLVGRVVLARETLHIRDAASDPTHAASLPTARAALAIRSWLGVPILREDEPIGVIVLVRVEVMPFSAQEIALVQTFATQAVIAIENARLFNETKEALEQQTATSEILQVISRSPTELQPVLAAVAESAARVCWADDAMIRLVDGDALRLVAHYGPLPDLDEIIPRDRGSATGRAIADRRAIHIHDLAAESEGEFPVGRSLQRRFHHRTVLAVPLLREGVAIGGILIRRQEVRPFADKQIALLQTFADQAVIAIENVRLFTELQEKNQALTQAHAQVTETLEQQTATSEILQAIAQAQTDAQPVFDAIVGSAVRLLEADSGLLTRIAGDQIEIAALTSTDPADDAILRAAYPLSRHSDRVHARVIRDRETLNIADAQTDPRLPDVQHATARARGYRSHVAVPLIGHDEVVGAIAVTRREPGGFSDDEIELLKTFADQAVIAIENVRLFTELQEKNQALTEAHAQVTEALDQQTATSEILRVISSSPTDVQPTFEAIAASAAKLCEAADSGVFRFEAGLIHLVAHHDPSGTRADVIRQMFPMPPGRASVTARAILTQAVVHIPDIAEDPEYGQSAVVTAGFRSVLSVPMLRDGQPVGAITVSRRGVKPFSGEHIGLLKTFADQAVIAIENVRLFKELQSSNRELTAALEQQTATGEILGVISSSPTDVQPVFDTIVKSAMRLLRGRAVTVRRLVGDELVLAAYSTTTDSGDELARSRSRILLTEEPALGQLVHDRVPHMVSDTETDPTLGSKTREQARARGFRSLLVVPLLREDNVIGTLGVGRREPGPFTDDQVALLQTFADQAVIAIENVRLFTELQEKNRALTDAHAQVTESLDQQTATSEILRAISQSHSDVQPIFETITRNATRLCDGVFSSLYQFDGEVIDQVAQHNYTPEALAEVRRTFPTRPTRDLAAGRAVLDGLVVEFPDVDLEPGYRAAIARAVGARSILAVPMLRYGVPVGAISVARIEAGRFSNTQIELLKTFADQAVIAIENVRLFTELQARNRDLTATSEILGVISRSPTDTRPVFDAIARNAVALCGGIAALVLRYDSEMLHIAGHHEMSPDALERVEQAFPRRPERDYPPDRALLERQVVHIPDLQAATEFTASTARQRGLGSMLVVPLLREGEAIGVISLARDGVGPFSAQQIEVLQTFADQAVIAIENVRLFNELQSSNRELTTALDTQTATSDILRVISRSQTDVQPVFDAIVTSAVRLLGAYSGVLTRVEGDQIQLAALTSINAAFVDAARGNYPRPLHDAGAHARAIRDRAPLNIADIETDRRLPEPARITARIGGYRSFVAVPLVHHDEALGALGIGRSEPGGFTHEEIALLQTFADQAVIAIENARLLSELQERTQELTRSVDQLTALGEVGRAVSSTLDLETVLTTIVSRAVELSGLDEGVVFEYDEGEEVFVQRAATEQQGGRFAEARRTTRVRKGEGVVGRTALTLEPTQVADITVPGAYESRIRENLIVSGVRALLAVPMVREDRLIGTLVVARYQPGTFADGTIDLLRTFATQSALAIQNARLFREIEEKSRQLEVASQHKSEFLANMSHELRTPLNAIIGFSEVLTDRMFGELNEKQEEYLKDINASGGHLLSLINDILDLSKIEAGRMELELTDFDLPTALDSALTLVRERAGRRGIALQMNVDNRLGQIQADERKVRQVVLNLLSNAIKFTSEGGRIEVAATSRDGSVEVSVSDTGVGIAPEDQEKVFEEFRQVGTADKKAEGTGLGLTLCRKLIELHSGRIWVRSQMGQGSTFTFTIPVRARNEANAE